MSYCCGCPRQEHTTLEHTPLYCTPGLLWLKTHLYHKSKQGTQVDDSEALRTIQVSFTPAHLQPLSAGGSEVHCLEYSQHHQPAHSDGSPVHSYSCCRVLATPLLRYSWA